VASASPSIPSVSGAPATAAAANSDSNTVRFNAKGASPTHHVRCRAVMQMMRSASRANAAVNCRATWPRPSTPSAAKQRSMGAGIPWPTMAWVPADVTTACGPKAFARSSSAAGERQMFPVQTVKMLVTGTT